MRKRAWPAAAAMAGALLTLSSAAGAAAPISVDACERAASMRPSAELDVTRTGTGPRLTQYLSTTSYRVLDCNESTGRHVAITAEAKRLPDGTVAFLPHQRTVDTPRGPETISAEFGDLRLYDGDWRAAVASARDVVPLPASPSRLSASDVPPLDDDPAITAMQRRIATEDHDGIRFGHGTEARAAADYRCGIGDYAFGYQPYSYKPAASHYINLAMIGVEHHAAFIEGINQGFNAWQYNYNICDFPPVDGNGVTAATLGWTQTPAANGDGSAGNNDGLEVVDAGALSGGMCAGALACAYSHYDQRHDVRISTAYPWCMGWCAGHYDIQSVMAHEAGHVYGFDHARTPEMVMGPTIPVGDAGKRYLWGGDYRGLRDVY